MMVQDDEIANMEEIALHLKILVEADSISVSDTENYKEDLESIEKKIHNMKVEAVLNSLPQIEDSLVLDDKCGNCGDTKSLHSGPDGCCTAFGTCKCCEFIPITLDSIEVPFNPKEDIET